ncbi:MAG: translation initiation factor [Alphaproteobacteria bacterium]|nr:translation initiation factor [Alphaproteobacteria bacterium]
MPIYPPRPTNTELRPPHDTRSENRSSDENRINEQIRVPKVRAIDADGEMLGVLNTRDAIEKARDAGLDLVEISPNAEPPVCKIMDYGKFRYQQQKKKAEARKKQKIIEIKELKLRPSIDDHDLEVKMRAAIRFLDEGDKVKFTLRFRGREMAHQEIGMRLLARVRATLLDKIRVEQEPKFEGNQVIMVVAPAPAAAKTAAPKTDKPDEAKTAE